MKRVVIGLAAFLLSSGASAQSGAPPAAELNPQLRAEFEALPKVNPTAPLRLIKFNTIAGSNTIRGERRYQEVESGLWGVIWLVPGKDGKAVLRQMLTFQGLIELASVTDMSVDYETTIALPVAKLFVPFGVSNAFKINALRNTTRLSGDFGAIKAAAPNSKFSYSHAYAVDLKMAGMSRNSTHELKLECTVGALESASKLHPDFRGSSLPVACAGAMSEGKIALDFAYLVDSLVYVPTASVFPNGSKETYSITEVHYAQ